MKGIIALLLAATLAVVLTACGEGHKPRPVATYSSAQRVMKALDRGGLSCTGVEASGSPVVAGATSEASCNFGATQNLVDVFPGPVSLQTVRKNALSTGSQQIWVAYGLNWWVLTDRAYVHKVQRILGGRITPGPWNQDDSGNVVDPITMSCTGTARVLVMALVRDQESQNRAEEQNWVGVVDGSLTTQGRDLQNADNRWAGAGGTQFGNDAAIFSGAVQHFLSDQDNGLQPGWTSEYDAVKQDIATLASDCGIS